MSRAYGSSNTSFGTSGQLTERNNNGIIISSEIINVISTLSGRSGFVLNDTSTVVETQVFNGFTDEDLRIMIQNLQKHFMELM